MRILSYFSLFTVLSLAIQGVGYSQPAAYKNVVLFEDNFSTDTLGNFPAHWHISDVDSDIYHGVFKQKNRRMFTTGKTGDTYEAQVMQGAQPMLEPNVATGNYVGDSFKVEYDFQMASARAITNVYFIGPGEKTKNATVCELAANGDFFCLGMTTAYMMKSSRYPSSLYPSGWHHFEAYYSNGQVKCFIDDYLLATIENLKVAPASIMMNPRGALKLRNFRLTEGRLAKDKEARPYTVVPTETRLFKQLPTDNATVAVQKKSAPTSNSTKLFNQLPEESRTAPVKKVTASSNETRLFNTLPEEPKTATVKNQQEKGNKTRLFNTIPEEQAPAAPAAPGDKSMVAEPVHFNVNQLEVIQSNAPILTQLAQFLQSNPAAKLEIDGHTDSDGSRLYNLNLSHARAEEVKKRLVAMGVQSSRIFTKGLGATKPMKPNTSRRNKAENRRVEFIKQ